MGTQAHAVARAEALGLVPSVRAARATGVVTGERGRDPLVVLGGRPGDTLDEVAHTLVAHGFTVVHAHRPNATGDTVRIGREHWYGWHQGPLVVVLVDPCDQDWGTATPFGAPVVVIRDEPSVEPDADHAAAVGAVLHGASAVLRRDQVRGDLASVLHLVGRGYLALGAEFLAVVADCLSGPRRRRGAHRA